MSANLGADASRRRSTRTPASVLRRRSWPLWPLGVAALAVGPGLLAPSATLAGPGPGASRSFGGPASGETRAGREGACSIEIEVAPSQLTAGESATVAGTVACASPSQTSEQTIAIYQHSAGTPGASLVGTATPEASGAFRFTTEALEADSSFYARSQDGRSARSSVEVAPLVTISGPPADTQLSIVPRRSAAGAGASSTLTFTGTVGPDEAGARVVLQRGSTNVATGEVGADGEYSITHTFGIPGTVDVHVLVRAHGRLLAGVSESLTYQIARPQDPQLTVQASACPLVYGQSLTLSGVAAGQGHEPLTLLASAGGGAFTPVATTTSEGDGRYAFAPQSPLTDTWYRVTGPHARSAILLEGVKPLLTAQASSASVPSGEPATFTGTIAPARAGQVVELERQDPDGLGFHVVAVATAGPGGSFSMQRTLSGAGTQTFRIAVPGAAGMQATASEPLEVDVIPAPASALAQQAPGAPAGEP